MLNTKYQILCQKIISGGQTGVDRGTLDACLNNNFPCGGWCPKERLAEDGIIDKKYPLTETAEKEYHYRTKLNIIDSDGTLIISNETLVGGTLVTKQIATEFNKPLLIILPTTIKTKHFLKSILPWLKDNSIKTLNVAGPRESEWKNAHETSFKIINWVIYEINNSLK